MLGTKQSCAERGMVLLRSAFDIGTGIESSRNVACKIVAVCTNDSV